MLEQHVAPQHQRFAVPGGFPVEKAEVVGVLAGQVGRGCVRRAPSEVIGLVAAQVEPVRRKTRQKFVQDAADQILGVGVPGVQGASPRRWSGWRTPGAG